MFLVTIDSSSEEDYELEEKGRQLEEEDFDTEGEDKVKLDQICTFCGH